MHSHTVCVNALAITLLRYVPLLILSADNYFVICLHNILILVRFIDGLTQHLCVQCTVWYICMCDTFFSFS